MPKEFNNESNSIYTKRAYTVFAGKIDSKY